MSLYSIGHSNHSIERFLELLQSNGIRTLVDVRSQPYSKFSPHFEMHALKRAATEAGIEYQFMGRQLGGRPEGIGFYDSQGFVLYDVVAESRPFHDGLQQLQGLAKPPAALLCSEEDPLDCHRWLLVGRVLRERGIPMKHIRGDGRLQSDEELLEEEARRDPESSQMSLFGEPEPKLWRSPKPIR
jgi:uncharacterized protein (DUF488 family)